MYTSRKSYNNSCCWWPGCNSADVVRRDTTPFFKDNKPLGLIRLACHDEPKGRWTEYTMMAKQTDLGSHLANEGCVSPIRVKLVGGPVKFVGGWRLVRWFCPAPMKRSLPFSRLIPALAFFFFIHLCPNFSNLFNPSLCLSLLSLQPHPPPPQLPLFILCWRPCALTMRTDFVEQFHFFQWSVLLFPFARPLSPSPWS